MLSFYEMNCLLEKANKSTKTVSEASDAMSRHLAAIAAAQSSAKPAELEAPTPAQEDVPPANPYLADRPAKIPATSIGGTSPNEPGTAAHLDNFQTNFIDRGREGIRQGNHKAQPNQADNGVDKFTDKLIRYNGILANDVSLRGLTAMAIADLGLPYKVPEGKFEIAANMSRAEYAKGNTDEFAELVMKQEHIVQLMGKVYEYTKGDKGGGGYKMASDFKKELTKNWDSKKGFNQIILRALQFERHFLDKEIVLKPMSATKLAAALASKAGAPSNFNGAEKVSVLADPQTASQNMDLEALNYILKIADKKGFGQFFERDYSNPSDPIITILDPHKAGQKGGGGQVFGSTTDRMNSKFGSAPAPQEECNQWMDMMDMLEHWNFKH